MDIRTISIDDVGLSVRSSNALHRARIFTVEELMELTEDDLIAIHNLGRKSIDEIMYVIARIESECQNVSPDAGSHAGTDTGNLTTEDIRSRKIKFTDMSVRAKNCLKWAGFNTVGDIVGLTEDDILKIPNLGKKTADEILCKIPQYRALMEALPEENSEAPEEAIDPVENYEEWLENKANQTKVIAYLQSEDIGVDKLDVLSVKAYNLLAFAGIRKLCQIVFMNTAAINEITRMDPASANEIKKACHYYLRKNKDMILDGVHAEIPNKAAKPRLSVQDMLCLPEYHDRIRSYVKANDLDLSQMNLSVRALGALKRNGYYNLSEIIFMSRMDFTQIRNMGNLSVEEILGKINEYADLHQDKILAFVNGDSSVLISEDSICERILKIYQTMGFNGLHFPEILEKLNMPEDVDDSVIKRCIGKLIAEGELEYIDYLVYRIYPSFYSYLDKCLDTDGRAIRCVRKKLQGETLEAIGQFEGITRERVRQILKKADMKVHSQYLAETGLKWFDEDYYRHLFRSYGLDRKVCTEWLGIPVETYYYLDMFNTKGKKDISEALDDPDIDVGLKLKISNFMNRDKIFIDGSWIEKKRYVLADYVLMKYCGDEITFDDFMETYNNFLASQGIPYSDDLHYNVDISRTRLNRLVDSRIVLWKQFQRLRYYDIDSRDYTELLDTLNLDAYENIELSTLKFIEDYPELMARYDIRDEYELHNLLKKIVPEGSCHDFHCGRMPIIRFGQFDRAEAFLNLLINNAPISKNDLVDLIHAEFGYDKATIAASPDLQSFNEYYHMGMYTIDSKVMPAAHKPVLKAALTEDFYYIDEIKRIYKELVPDAELETVNPYNLKSMGFTVLSKYVLQNWPSLEAYFRHLLISEDIVDIAPLKKRFGSIFAFSLAFIALKNEYEILEFEPNQIVSFGRLEKSGITKQMFKDYCDAVYQYIEDGAYFTAKSLRQSGFSDELYDLGFSDWFYANVLCADPRFSYGNMFGAIVLYKGNEAITVKSFLIDKIKRAGKLDIYDLMNDLNEDYGCNVAIKSDITQKIYGSEIFYDSILERLYANADLYYRELDEDLEGM